jgi:hypothetical protein
MILGFRKIVLGSIAILGMMFGLLQSDIYAEEIDRNDWIDWSLPRSVSVVPFEGERYEVEVPDTIDLVDHANYAINMATRLWVPEWGYEQLFDIRMDTNPPLMEVGHGGLTNCGPKVIEALPMLRVMTGSTYNIEVDDDAMMSIVRITGKDGLCYQPVENRPWAFFDDYSRRRGLPFSDVFGEGRQMLAYAAWYQHDKNPLWKELALKKVRRLLKMTLQKGDTLYFRMNRGYTPWDENRTKGDIVAIGDHNVYDKGKGMVGTPATCNSGYIPMAGSIWYRLTQDKEFLELSKGLARYLQLHGEMIDPETGEFLADHETHVTHSLIANLSWALTFEDQEMIQWVKKGYEYLLKSIDQDDTGILFGQEACLVGDTIGLGIVLSQAGVGDYWEKVDRLIRNTLLDMQVTEADWIKNQPLNYKKTLGAGWYQPADGADWCVGVLRHWLEKSSLKAGGCCNGNCSRMLYYIWDNLITLRDGQLRVNLLMNRASLWADVDSWLPYKGRVVINLKTDQDELLVRIPQWVDRNKANCTVGEKEIKQQWSEDYLSVGKVNRGDRVIIEFPMRTRTIKATTQLLLERQGEEEIWEKKNCEFTLKGNTVIDFTPDMGYPIEQHKKYRAEKAPMKKTIRFISKERFLY